SIRSTPYHVAYDKLTTSSAGKKNLAQNKNKNTSSAKSTGSAKDKKKKESLSQSQQDSIVDKEFEKVTVSNQLPWAVFDYEHIQKLLNTESNEEIVELLSEKLNITDYSTDLRSNIIETYYHSALVFCKENSLLPYQTGIIFYLFKYVMEHCSDNRMSLEFSLSEFKNLVQNLASKQINANGLYLSDPSVTKLTLIDVHLTKNIIQFFVRVFYQHYKLFQFVTSQKQDEEAINLSLEVSIHPKFPPLRDALKYKEYQLLKAEELRQLKHRQKQELIEKIEANPFEYLSTEVILSISSEALQSSLNIVQEEIYALVEQYKQMASVKSNDETSKIVI
ncbi:hypothetical protein O9G_005916, partial [Rozella allomycis CSF55]